jgi:hypothetical protein
MPEMDVAVRVIAIEAKVVFAEAYRGMTVEAKKTITA